MPILIRSEIHSTPYNTSTIDGYSTIQYNTSTIDGHSTIQYNTSTIDGYREMDQLYTTLKSLMSFPKCGLPYFQNVVYHFSPSKLTEILGNFLDSSLLNINKTVQMFNI